MKASVLITTRNRKEELREALRSASAQTAQPEVLVIDDGSTDGTSEMVRADFPAVVLHRREGSKGCIVRRNDGARLARGDVLFSIDDDAAFSTSQVVEQTLREFNDPRIGAVAIPYIEPHKGNRVMQKTPDAETVWITDRFIGTAHALRRDIFLKLGGYREHLVHQGEESDYSIRMLDAGYFVRLGNADPILHFESPERDFRRMDFYGRRNDVLFAWHNIPLPMLPVHLLATTCKGLHWGFKAKRPATMAWGLLCGYAACGRYFWQRRPVSRVSYRLFRHLRIAGSLSVEKVAARWADVGSVKDACPAPPD
jgi:glycosyltransferase involved in cell wall biosynthesis